MLTCTCTCTCTYVQHTIFINAPNTYYHAPPPTPAALPIAPTRPKRPMAATNAAIQNSMQQLAATTRLGVKKKIYPN